MQLFNDDCLKILPTIPSHSVDLILCDLPYGTTSCSWDEIIPMEKLWPEYERIIKKDSAVILFGSEPFSSILRISNLKHFKYDWIWNKSSAGNVLNAKFQPLKIHEIISVFIYGKSRYNPILTYGYEDRTHDKPRIKKSDMFHGIKSGNFINSDKNKPADARYPKSIINISKQSSECCNSKSFHPTQKPVSLCEYIIQTYTKEGDIVLDNCMGVGSTGVAAVNLHRDFIGCEIRKDFYDIAEKRIKEAENGLL